MKILFLSFTCEDIGVAMVTNMIGQLEESFPLQASGQFFLNFIQKMAWTVQLQLLLLYKFIRVS